MGILIGIVIVAAFVVIASMISEKHHKNDVEYNRYLEREYGMQTTPVNNGVMHFR